MYLQKLQITTFRCFKHFEVEFAPGVTILFGKNGSGKTTLIHAIHKALSFVFKRNTKDEKGFDLTSGFPELKVEQYTKTDGVRNWKTGLLFPTIDIKANGSFLGTDLEWNMYASTSTFNLQPSKYALAHKKVIEKVNETNVLPFIAYYSDSFPHIPKPKSITEQQDGLRNLGYLDWNQESACSELWISRLKQRCELWDRADRSIQHEKQALQNCEDFLRQGIVTKEEYDEDIQLHQARLQKATAEKDKYNKEVSEIKSCLIRFSKGDANYELTNVFVSLYDNELWIDTSQNNNRSFHTLPAGYKRLFYIVLDIAYRSYLLNETTDAKGIVIIDEIDLHLHPELEKDVLKRFMETFPNLQFVVSTHSPLVLTGIETEGKPNRILRMNNRIQRLDCNNDTKETPDVLPDVYGLDYNTGLEDIMEVDSKNGELDYLISLCAYMRKRGKTVQAENIKQRIVSQFSKNDNELEKLIVKKEKDL